jgi:hypothetical protein
LDYASTRGQIGLYRNKRTGRIIQEQEDKQDYTYRNKGTDRIIQEQEDRQDYTGTKGHSGLSKPQRKDVI